MKNFKKILLGVILSLPFFVLAEDECSSISVNDDTIYRVCDGEVQKNNFNDDVEREYGLTFTDNVLHVNDGDVYLLVITSFKGLNISIDSDSVINSFAVLDSEITIGGEGVLNLGYEEMPVVFNGSKVTFDNANVVVSSDKMATPPANSTRASVILSGDDPESSSLFYSFGSNIIFNNSKLNILEGSDDGIELYEGSNLSINNSDVKIDANIAGIMAEDALAGTEDTVHSKMVIKNSNLNIDNTMGCGVLISDFENDNSNVTISSENANGTESYAVFASDRLASKNGKFHLNGYDFGLAVINPDAFELNGGLYDIESNLGTIALIDYGNKGPFKLNDTLVSLMGSSEIVFVEVPGESPYKIYSLGTGSEFDKKVLIKGYENINVTEGQGQSFYEGTQSNLVFKIDRTSLEYFEKILLNGEVIDANDYTIDGDTVTISQRVISKLAIGDYVITVKYTEGEANVNLSIIEEPAPNPFTGSVLGYVVIAGMILLICTAFIVMKHSWVSE